jgi:hypothetical protein
MRETARSILVSTSGCASGIDQPHVERGLPPFARDLQHVVDRRINAFLSSIVPRVPSEFG